jgi:hypothetical protein
MGRAVRGLPPLRCHCRSRRRLGGEAWAIHPCSHGFADCSETHRLASAHPPLLARVCLKCMRVVDEVQPSTPARTGLPRASRRRPLSRPIHPCSHGFARVTSFGSQYMNHPPLLARVCLPFRVLKRGGMPSTPARTGLPSRDMLNATLSAIHPCSHGFARKTPSAPRHAHPSTPAASSAPPIAIHPCSHGFANVIGPGITRLGHPPLLARVCLLERIEENGALFIANGPRQPPRQAKPCGQGAGRRRSALLPRRVLLQTDPLRSLLPRDSRQSPIGLTPVRRVLIPRAQARGHHNQRRRGANRPPPPGASASSAPPIAIHPCSHGFAERAS